MSSGARIAVFPDVEEVSRLEQDRHAGLWEEPTVLTRIRDEAIRHAKAIVESAERQCNHVRAEARTDGLVVTRDGVVTGPAEWGTAIPVDPGSFATRFPDVYAVGDITNAPVPRAGVIAEGEARTVADVIISRVTSGAPPPAYEGAAICYIEMGDEMVARVDVNFLAGSAPTASFSAPSATIAAEKRSFGQSRRQRWFG